MKCIFSLSGSGNVKDFNEMAIALAESARRNTSLSVFCVYDGEDDQIVGQLTSLGVQIIRHKPDYHELITQASRRYARRPGHANVWINPSLWQGTFLRLDIPLLLNRLGVEDPYVLYVDADVYFASDPGLEERRPEFFAAACEADASDVSMFNAGVMVLNCASMLATYDPFLAFCIDRRFTPRQGEGVVDQGLYNTFYKGKWEPLEPQYNWKVYWPPNPQASIIHFHGPKPREIKEYLEGRPCESPSRSVVRLLKEFPENLKAHADIWQRYLEVGWSSCAPGS